MFSFGSSASVNLEFLPDPDSRLWILRELVHAIARLAPHSDSARGWFHVPKTGVPGNIDQFLDWVCSIQAQIGQQDLELTLLPLQHDSPAIPKDYRALVSGEGQLIQTLYGRSEYVMVFTPALFKKAELFFASVARELGRIAIFEVVRDAATPSAPDLLEHAYAEIAAHALGLGVWITNGAYIFENGCCGGGCGVNLKSLRTGLSMPESAFALALDGLRRAEKKRSIAKQLAPNQKAAFLAAWKHLEAIEPSTLRALKTGNASALPAAMAGALSS